MAVGKILSIESTLMFPYKYQSTHTSLHTPTVFIFRRSYVPTLIDSDVKYRAAPSEHTISLLRRSDGEGEGEGA
jgi:hypothetical protein